MAVTLSRAAETYHKYSLLATVSMYDVEPEESIQPVCCFPETLFREWQTRLWMEAPGQDVRSCFCSRSVLL